jgi:prolyl 4-hydroxylase
MENVFKNDTAISYRNDCKARHELCAYWAALGECKKNPKYMLLHCAPVCQTCHEISFEHRCPFDKDAPTIWQQGDLNKMFERITTEQYYIDKFQPTVLSSDPWIVTLENVATKEECERMIKLGADRGYERSKDVGEK